MKSVKAIAFAVLAAVALPSVCSAGELNPAPASGLLIRVDWQDPALLPPRFRNHCTFENFTGRPYCSDHCGRDYQFYYCSQTAFGCCRLGHGYCGWDGALRCAP
jgi:hypothetical protein